MSSVGYRDPPQSFNNNDNLLQNNEIGLSFRIFKVETLFTVSLLAVCGGEWSLVDMPTGHLESPNYPEDYQSNKECIWKLTAPAEFQVSRTFISILSNYIIGTDSIV